MRLNVLYKDPLKSEVDELRFRLIPVDDKQYGPYFTPSDFKLSTSSASTLMTANGWFQHCYSTHTLCRRIAAFGLNQIPTRLIDVGCDGDTDWFLRVVDEEALSPASLSYMTLSYRWGSNPKLILLSSNLARFRQGAPICELPPLFRDFATVARAFHIRYVWIDSLCIIQDSVEDWEAEASKMRYVYANSACNIAALASNSPEESIFHRREIESIRPRMVRSSLFADRPSLHYIFEKGYWDRQLSDGPLHNRGWFFQERFLAPRVLYFGKDQILWECFSEHKCECFPHGIPAHWSDKKMDSLFNYMSTDGSHSRPRMPLHVFNLWNDIVKQYSRCDLTKASDKMFAIAGVAKLFHDITGDEYVAGWWKSRLLESLDWRVFEPRARISADYRAPSWSWASVDGPVRLTGLSPSTEFLVRLVDVHITTRGPDAMVNMLDGYIKLRGAIFVAICHYLEHGNRVLVNGNVQFAVWLYPDSLDIDFPEGKKVACIPFKKDYSRGLDGELEPHVLCFLAEETGIRHGSDVLYRRLGVFLLYTQEDVDYVCTIRDTTTIILI